MKIDFEPFSIETLRSGHVYCASLFFKGTILISWGEHISDIAALQEGINKFREMMADCLINSEGTHCKLKTKHQIARQYSGGYWLIDKGVYSDEDFKRLFDHD